MLYWIYHFFVGYYEAHIRMKSPGRALNLFLRQGMRIWRIRFSEEGLFLRIRHREKACATGIFADLTARYGAEIEVCERGLPRFFRRYRLRVGLAIGILTGIFLMTLSTFFVWGVTIETNTMQYTERELYEFLEECGVFPGILKSSVTEQQLNLNFQLAHPEFIFVSFNIEGTHLTAELMERAVLPESEPEIGPCHLTAAQGGIIRSCEVYNGEPMVRQGDVVNAGDLLVSGTMTLRAGGYRVVESRAKILAETYREFECSVLLSENVVSPNGNEASRTALRILGVDLLPKVWMCSPYETYEAVEEWIPLTFFGAELPLSLHRLTYLECESQTVIRTPERAKELCYDAYRTWISEILGEEGEVLEEEITVEELAGELTLRASVRCVENIVCATPFSLDLSDPAIPEEVQ